MISETITIPKTISDQEDRFVVKLKENLLRIIKEVNKNSKKISNITGEEDPDYTEDFAKKANVIADNIGYGELFEEDEDYDVEQNLIDWGSALTNKDNKIEEDNKKLVSSENIYDETHPYMEKDEQGQCISNPYHYINYKNLITHEGGVDINKQDRWSEQDIFQPHEPNDNMVKENLIALDTAIYELSKKVIEVPDVSTKANTDASNVGHYYDFPDIRTRANLPYINTPNMGDWGEAIGLMRDNNSNEFGLNALDLDPNGFECTGLPTAELIYEELRYEMGIDLSPFGINGSGVFNSQWTIGRNINTMGEQLVTVCEDLYGQNNDNDGFFGLFNNLQGHAVDGQLDVTSEIVGSNTYYYSQALRDVKQGIDDLNTLLLVSQGQSDVLDEINRKLTDFENRIQALEDALDNAGIPR